MHSANIPGASRYVTREPLALEGEDFPAGSPFHVIHSFYAWRGPLTHVGLLASKLGNNVFRLASLTMHQCSPTE